MFINLFEKLNFRGLNLRLFIFLLLSFYLSLAEAQQLLKGIVVEQDSSTAMPFVYIINKSTGNGTMSDNEGRFTLASRAGDTLLCSYVGYLKLYIPVNTLKPNKKGEIKVVMTSMPINLGMVNITTFKFKPYERAYMNDIIDKSRIKQLDYAGSPITALYMKYSKEGKQIQKLAKIFEQILIEEEVQKKLNREILVKLTGDETIDYYAFRRYCYYVNDYYIMNHEGVELYTKVLECYKRFKGDKGGYRKREETKESE